MTALDVGLVTTTTPTRRVERCTRPVDITALGEVERRYVCGCGRCNPPPPPTCVCGDRGTHRPEPGIGCTRPGCLCLEPGEPAPRPPAPPDTSWLRMERIR